MNILLELIILLKGLLQALCCCRQNKLNKIEPKSEEALDPSKFKRAEKTDLDVSEIENLRIPKNDSDENKFEATPESETGQKPKLKQELESSKQHTDEEKNDVFEGFENLQNGKNPLGGNHRVYVIQPPKKDPTTFGKAKGRWVYDRKY